MLVISPVYSYLTDFLTTESDQDSGGEEVTRKKPINQPTSSSKWIVNFFHPDDGWKHLPKSVRHADDFSRRETLTHARELAMNTLVVILIVPGSANDIICYPI